MSPNCRSRLALSTLSVLGLAAGLLAQDEAERPAARVTQVVAVVKRTGPAVVSVYSDGADPAAAPGGEGGKGASLGSGLLIDADGFILTDTHVLPRGTEGIRVRLHDGGSFPATLVNLDLDNDVALLKISPRPGAPFATARLGTSSDLMVGETVIAIGTRSGESTASSGIVSSLGRGAAAGRGRDFIRIDARIDAGNGGGPVLNIDGDVIGIMDATPDRPAGMGRAIPVDRILRSLTCQLLDPCLLGEVVTGFELASGRGGRDVTIAALTPGGPAERAGLQPGDRLLEAGGAPVNWEFEVNKALLASGPGQLVPLRVARGDQCLDVPLVLERGESPVLQVWRRVGVRIVDHSRYKGVRVARVDPTGPAARLGLREGDLIDGLDERLLDGTEDLVRSVHDLPGGTAVTIHVWRGREAWAGSLTLR